VIKGMGLTYSIQTFLQMFPAIAQRREREGDGKQNRVTKTSVYNTIKIT
jgi:hypothetical protein